MKRNEHSLPDGTFFTTGTNYRGLSNVDKQHALINEKTGERTSLIPMMDVTTTGTLKNGKIPARITKQLRA